MGEDVQPGDSQLVPGDYRMESGAGRKRKAEHRAISLRRYGDDSFADQGDHAQRTVLGVCAFFSKREAWSPAIRISVPAPGGGTGWIRESRRAENTRRHQPWRGEDGHSETGE